MYPSGVDTHKGTVYIADTGNDQVAAYRADGTQRWRVGDARVQGSPEASTIRETSPTTTAACTLPTQATTACRC